MGPYYHLMLPDYWPGEVEHLEAFHNTHIVARHEWGAKKPRARVDIKGPIGNFRFRFTETDECSTFASCREIVQRLQKKHMREGYPDIQYSFLIGGDDNFYEGAGWNYYVKDIQQGTSEEDNEPVIILAYISREEEFYKDKLKSKHMEKQGYKLFRWAVENRKILGDVSSLNVKY